jgi:hypothetical protein
VTARRLALVLFCFSAFSVPAASAHSDVPRAWWLDEQAAVTSLREAVRPRYRPAAFRTFRGHCTGRSPRATRAGRAVYKHFGCSARIRANGVTFSFGYTLHVTGPHGRVIVGG